MSTSFASASSPTSTHGLQAGIRIVAGRVTGLFRAIAHRRAVGQLLELDDRALKDIGLVRNDVTGALASSIEADPSVVLIVRAVGHRSRLRHVAPARGRVGVGEAEFGNLRQEDGLTPRKPSKTV